MRKAVTYSVPIDADKLRRRLDSRRMSTQDLADALRIPFARAHALANGGQIDYVSLYRLSKLFHCPMRNFLPDDFQLEGV